MHHRIVRPRALAMALSAVALAAPPGVLQAHEFWLEPHRYRLAPGDELVADVRNGQDFVGDSFPYLPDRHRRLYLLGDDGRRAIDSRTGDVPAVRQRVARSGDYTLVLESAENAVSHDTLADFREYLAYHGLERVESVHRELGLPERDISEVYSRFAKSLVAVGDEDAGDAPPPLAGLTFEIVPHADPRAPAATTLPVSVHVRRQALTGAQVEIFRRAPDGTVTRETTLTDERGVATIDVGEPGEYLLNAVQLIRPRLRGGRARTDVHWESLWASLTFERP